MCLHQLFLGIEIMPDRTHPFQGKKTSHTSQKKFIESHELAYFAKLQWKHYYHIHKSHQVHSHMTWCQYVWTDTDIFTEQFSLKNILLIHSRLIFHYNCACHIGIIRSVVRAKPVLEQNSKKVRK